MNKIVIRHGLSEANNYKNRGTPAFGSPDAPLMGQGRIDAASLAQILAVDYAIDPSETHAAASAMRRTKETAERAGFSAIHTYPVLNEVDVSLHDRMQIKETREIPKTALPIILRAAEAVLESPPEEPVWFSHGLLIAGMCKVLGIYQERTILRPYPRFCEIRELPL